MLLQAKSPPAPASAPSARITALDGLRGVAALLVVSHHIAEFPANSFLGLDMFFALSGFLITGIMLDEISRTSTLNFRRFYLGRSARLIPGFIVLYAFCIALSFVVPDTPSVLPTDLPGILLLTNIRTTMGANPFFMFGHVWTLSLEWQFYLIWPLIVLGASKTKMAGLLIFSLCIGGIIGAWVVRTTLLFDLRIDALLVGSMFAVFIRRENSTFSMNGKTLQVIHACLALTCAVLIFSPGIFVNQLAFSSIVITMAVFACVSGIVRDGPVSRVLQMPALTYVGTLSYGLYLFHWPVIVSVHAFWPDNIFAKAWALPIGLGMAHLSWKYIEKPALDLFSRYRRTKLTASRKALRPLNL